MPDPTPEPQAFPSEELADRIDFKVWELNLLIRAAILAGLKVHVDTVERPDESFPDHSRPEVLVSAKP